MNRVVFRLAMRDLLRSKKALFALLVSLVPAILAVLAVVESMGYQDAPWHPLLTPGLAFVGLTVSIPITCLILAGGLLADEAEDRTLSYLLVRPIPRRTLYLSRGLAVALVAVALSAVQVLTTWLVELVAFSNLALPDQTVDAVDGGVVDATVLVSISPLLALLVAAVAAVLYTAMFGAGSVIFPRYHFFGNLTFFAIWELMFGFVPIATAWLSGSHALRAWLAAMDPTLDAYTYAEGGLQWLGLPVVLVLVVAWTLIGARIMQRRDFHVTSAAT